MKRFKNTAVSILLVVTLSVMGIPSAAFGEVNEAVSASISASQEQAAALSATDNNTAGSDSSRTTITDQQINSDGTVCIDGYFSVSTEEGRDYEFHYKDSYFDSSSYTFDWSLAAMSNCLALSAFGADTGDTDADYADADANVKSLLTTLGYTDYECTEEFHKVPTSESIGAAIANKTIVDTNGEKHTLIAVAVRGGNYEQEWAGNAIIGDGTGEAKGFGIARDKVANLILSYLEEHEKEFTQQPKIWIVGYSRGSAVANLTANFLNYCMESYQTDPSLNSCSTELARKMSNALYKMGMQQSDLYSYCFEVPAGGTDQSVYSCKTEYKNIWNIINPMDIVPLLAPSEWGFKRYGTDVDPTEGITEEDLTRQLGAISDKALDDWNSQTLQKDNGFRLYYGSIVDAITATMQDGNVTSLSYVSKNKEFMGTYLKAFVKFLADYSIGSRSAYVSSYQDVFSIVAQIMFAGGNITKITDVAWKGMKDGFGAWMWTKLIAKLAAVSLAAPIALLFGSTQRGVLEGTAEDCLDNAFDALYDDTETRAMLGDKGFSVLKNHKDDLIKLALDLATENNEIGGVLSGIAFIPTALYYKGEIMYGHDDTYNYALVRAHDSNYSDVVSSSSYRLDIASSSEGGALDNCKITVKDSEGNDLAYLEKGGFVNHDGDTTVHYSQNYDGTESLYVDKNEDANKNVTFEITGYGTNTNNVYLKYYDYTRTKNGMTITQSTDDWCNKAITFNNTATIKVKSSYDSTDATMEKWINVRLKFYKYNEEAIGHYENIETNGLQVSIGVDSANLEGKVVDVTEGKYIDVPVIVGSSCAYDGKSHYENIPATFEVCKKSDSTCTYIPTWVFEPEFNTDGTVAIDSNGDYKRAQTFESTDYWGLPMWNTTYDLDSLGNTYYVVCDEETSVTYPISKKATFENGTAVTDMNINVEAPGSSSLVHVAAGTEVKVSAESTGSDVFKRWNFFETGITEDEVTYTKGDKSEFTFIMPKRPVMLNAICTTKEDVTYNLTVTGGWDSNHGTPADYGWVSTAYDTDDLDASSTKTYTYAPTSSTSSTDEGLEGENNTASTEQTEGTSTLSATADDTSTSHLFYLNANAYAKDSNGTVTQQFDHWEVVDAVGDTHDELKGIAADGSTYTINGCTDQSICIDGANLTESLTVRSVYKDIEFTYELRLSDESLKSGSEKPGVKRTFRNSVPTGYACTSWEATVTPVTYSTDEHGYITATKQAAQTETIEGSDITLTFVGDVVAKANTQLLSYKLAIAESGLPEGASAVKSVTTTAGDKLDLDNVPAGTQVKLTLEYPEGYQYLNYSGLTSGSAKVVKDGNTVTFTFTMPGKDTNLTLKAAEESYKLTYSGCTATDAEGKAVASGDKVMYGTSMMLVAAAAPEGQEFDTWKVEAANGATVRQSSYKNAIGENVLVFSMPESDVTVTPQYKESAKTPIESAEIKVLALDSATYTDGVLTEGDTLPTKLSLSGTGIANNASLVWLNEDGSAVTSATVEKGKLYKVQVTLNAENGYCFNEDFKATIDGNQATIANLGANVIVLTCSYVARAKEYKKPYNLVAHNVLSSDYASFECDANQFIDFLTANDAYPGSTYTGFTVEPAGAVEIKYVENSNLSFISAISSLLSSNDSPSQSIEFTMPSQNVQLTANYTIDTIELSVTAPVAGEQLSCDVSFVDNESAAAQLCKTSAFYVDAKNNTIDTPYVATSGTRYFMYIMLSNPELAGYTFSENCVATVNGQQADVSFTRDGACVLCMFDTPADESDNGDDADNTKDDADNNNANANGAGSNNGSAAASTGDMLGIVVIAIVVIAILAAGALIIARRKKNE